MSWCGEEWDVDCRETTVGERWKIFLMNPSKIKEKFHQEGYFWLSAQVIDNLLAKAGRLINHPELSVTTLPPTQFRQEKYEDTVACLTYFREKKDGYSLFITHCSLNKISKFVTGQGRAGELKNEIKKVNGQIRTTTKQVTKKDAIVR